MNTGPEVSNQDTMCYFNHEIETLTLPKLRNLQNARLRDQVKKIYDTVPFYKQQFAENDLTLADINSVDDLHKLSLPKKQLCVIIILLASLRTGWACIIALKN